jgi:uroporphyrin-III C-methyltransferase
MSGHVALVGAGPGDPELLTLKGARLLREADVVLYDALVAPEILALARRDARLIAVGKRGGCRSTPQRFIEELLIREARAGHKVVRLKGGDSFVFGRGGEEVMALRAAGVTVEVVGGVTSGLAAPAAVGIPVTHRSLAHGVALVTGHAADGDHTEIDWNAMVRTGLTLVIYMGMTRVSELRTKLLAAGMPSTTPVAIIANATRPAQDAIVTSLGVLVEQTLDSGVASPAIIVVGDVVAIADAARVRQSPADGKRNAVARA